MKSDSKSKITEVLGVLLLVIAAGCALFVVFYILQGRAASRQQKMLAEDFRQNREGSEADDGTENQAETDESGSKRKAIEWLKSQNKDAVGWLWIPDTQIDLPVVKGEDNTYYLTHSFEKEKDRHGAIFMDYRVDEEKTPSHRILYGHRMKDGTMFQDLKLFKDGDFCREHGELYYTDSDGGEHTYRIFGVCYLDNGGSGWNWERFLDLSEEGIYSEYTDTVYERSIYKEEKAPGKPVPVLTLITCDYSRTNGRLLVAAYEIET